VAKGSVFHFKLPLFPYPSKNLLNSQTAVIHWYIYMSTPSTDDILVGRGDQILTHSFDTLRRHLEEAQHHRSPRLSFMTHQHHRVRDFVVTELPRLGHALSPEHISAKTSLSLDLVSDILDELEANRFFLVRDRNGRVSWAFPVTSERTPHGLELSTGESIYAA
jgi:hypothetical protein